MNLIIDVGNTRIKTAVFNSKELIHTEIFTKENLLKNVSEIIEIHNCKHAIIAAVADIEKVQIEKLQTKINLTVLNSDTKIPFKNSYSSPKTLGVDRIALVAAAVSKYPNTKVLIIDAGTCITYDFVDESGIYYGGAISPGIRMRYKSLHTFTENLPLLETHDIHQLTGNSTEASIHSGVINGAINEIDSLIEQYRKKNKDLTVVLTGGDVNFLANKLKNGIFANPNFLIEGLNAILTHNLV
jgi:type III pantothenate kinase